MRVCDRCKGTELVQYVDWPTDQDHLSIFTGGNPFSPVPHKTVDLCRCCREAFIQILEMWLRTPPNV